VDVGFFKHKSNAEGVRLVSGVQGHTPLESLKCDFKCFEGEILQNYQDNKVHQRHDFYDLTNILYLLPDIYLWN
jgi:hypothetical protein